MRSIRALLNSKNSIQGRGQHRLLRVGLSGIVSLAQRAIAIAAGLFSIPLTAHYLGTERFGVWLIVSTFLLAWSGVADLGLMNSLTNALSKADGRDDRQQAKEIVTSAFCIICIQFAILTTLFLLIYPWVSWSQIFNVNSSQIQAEINLTALITIALFLLRLLLSISGRIYDAYQEGYLYQLWTILGNVLGFVALVVAIQLQAGLPILLVAFFGSAGLGDLCAGAYMFGWRRQWLKPNLSDFNWSIGKALLRTGIQIWICQLAAIIIFQTDLIIVAQLFGAAEVGSYGIALKLFSLIMTTAYAFTSPLWPAYSEATTRNDIPWIQRTFRRSILFNLGWSIPVGIAISVLCPFIVKTWLDQNIHLSYLLIFALFFNSVLVAIAHCISSLLNGLDEFSTSAVLGVTQGIVNLILSIWLGQLLGSAGVALATGISLSIFAVGLMGMKALERLKILQNEYDLSKSIEE